MSAFLFCYFLLRSFNDHRHKHKGFQNRDNHNMQGKGGFKRQRHGSASAGQREAAYVLCSESDFPSLAAGPSGNEVKIYQYILVSLYVLNHYNY